jgi:hypothetical protein
VGHGAFRDVALIGLKRRNQRRMWPTEWGTNMCAMAVPETFRERIRPLRRVEYDQMVDMGLLVDEKVELIKGFIVRMSPQGLPHASIVQYLTQFFVLALAGPGRASVRVQAPMAASDDSEPEPDIAVVERRSYRDTHPTTAFLIIEVSEVHTDIVDGAYSRVTPYARGQSLAPRAFPDVVLKVDEILG